mmetsp:Transcript_5398/g.11345  ORF Transcript_5398/g.11345 Transcript_5398/m.11345 type:complete len:301 (-) Transcript_5398:473-1375(-)|eukprot:CAMPEP_0201125542 /NCGR_PEP_ID=MMETSP0850-20130426/21781_1 /ASSEMBLY_ACC=CAM_ASM_000622 /TAXON_ID=183588 /ORGANISM="Pseudo-nitzschia fraudulenta, Strain WWA7" /LENGTH=300 /DNA_ID=CAMNT_0047393597 /DNA_START=240 /DNA_END=1142 /DNA_ORIENTATION=-
MGRHKNKNGSQSSSTHEESVGSSENDELVQLLALQAYHLPGNNYLQDWWQFMANNHPVFGICCHYRAHPIKGCTRIVALIGTITFGLALTNFFYLFFLWNPEFDRVLASIFADDGTEFLLTTGMLLLWTVGSGIHCTFNLAIWHIAACACCQSGGFCESYACCPSLGKYMIRFFVLCTVALSALIILLRVAINDELQEDITADDGNITTGINIMMVDDQIELSVDSASEFTFVLTYLVEMTLTLFVYYPIGGTIIFSGILSCGYEIPILGGRPYEIGREERRNSRQKRETLAKGSSDIDA